MHLFDILISVTGLPSDHKGSGVEGIKCEMLIFTLFTFSPLSFGKEDVGETEQRGADQERRAEGDL